MKSHILSLSFLLLACLGMVACSEHDWADMEQTKGIELSVSCANVGITRATKPGEVNYNENLIKTVHYFLYPQGKTNENAVISGKIDVTDGSGGYALIHVPLNETELNSILFPLNSNIRTCEVYLIANLPENLITDDSDTSIDALKNLAISTDFKANATQASFIMDGQCSSDLLSRNQTVVAEGEIELKRLAVKFTTSISVVSSFIDTDGKEYTPQVDAMQIHLDNAGKNTTLSGAFATELFDYDQRIRIGTKTENVDGTSTTYSVFAPFYSYPRKWDYDDNALVMYVMLPWVYQQDGVTKTQHCYYKVYPGAMQLDRNSWYNLDLKIGVLGSFTQEEELVTLTDFRYKVVDWKNGYDNWGAGVNLETEILSAYYLVVEQNEYVINNKNTFEIPFVTSHECEIHNLTVKRKEFKSGNDETPRDVEVAHDGWLTLQGNTIKLNHNLNNDFINTKTYDFSPYVFTFTLRHKNNPDKFKEEITITQKPALCVSAQLNSYYDNTDGGVNGYQYVNGNTYQGRNNNNYSYGGAGGLTGHNKNPYMYVVEVTVLPAGSDYILADPRVNEPFTPTGYNDFVSAPGVEGSNSRKLTNYFSTSRDASVQNIIAPKFRIASSHGAVSSFISYENAFNRAATYQEDGYPAGRWRVPTLAEVRFVAKLFSDGIIPSLFSSGTTYWHSTGTVTPNQNGTVNSSNSTSGSNTVRCVYDDWYWENSQWPRMASLGDHPNKYNKFTWGDEIN